MIKIKTNLFASTGFIVLAIIPLGVSLYYPTYFMSYVYRGCIGEGDTFWTSHLNLTNVLAFSETSRGLWRYSTDKGMTVTRASHESGTSCSTPANVIAIKTLENLIPSDLDDSALVLHSEDTYKGAKIFFNVNETEKSYEASIKVGSYALTGTGMYTVFQNTNFTGNRICVRPDGVPAIIGRGLTWDFGSSYPGTPLFYAGSIRRGCGLKNTYSVFQGNRSRSTLVMDTKGNEIKDWLAEGNLP